MATHQPSAIFGPTPYTYIQLAQATNAFSNEFYVGEGGFGQVYMGTLNGKTLAIKKLRYLPEQMNEGLMDEIMVVNNIRHRNLVKLVGYCIDDSNVLLVLEHFPKKCLRTQLHTQILDWQTRMKIAIGSANGLEYLHEYCDSRIIHRDIKPDNILLDNNFEPKIADFGLARFFPNDFTHLSKSIAGTEVYLDPTHSNMVSYKSDVYSFSVVLLQLITGREHKVEGIGIVNWAKSPIERALEGKYEDLADPKLPKNDNETEMKRMITEMKRMIFCVIASVYEPLESRPTMKKIVRALEGDMDLQKLCEWKNYKHLILPPDTVPEGS